MLYKEALSKLAELDPAILEKATAHVTGNAKLSMPLTAPAALLAAALTPGWTDKDVEHGSALNKLASKWFPKAMEIAWRSPDYALRGKLTQARALQKATARRFFTIHSGAVPSDVNKMLDSRRALQLARAVSAARPEVSVREAYKTLRMDPTSLQGLNARHALLKDIANKGSLSEYFRYVNNVKHSLEDSKYWHVPVTFDKDLVSFRGFMNVLPKERRQTLSELMKRLRAGRSATVADGQAFTAEDVRNMFGTNELLFHGDSSGTSRSSWLRGTRGSRIWFSPLAPVSVGYASGAVTKPGIMHVYAIPKGELGAYTRQRFTPHLADSYGDLTAALLRRRAASGNMQDAAARLAGTGVWGNQPNYEFVLDPSVRGRWFRESIKAARPRSFYVDGNLPSGIQDNAGIQAGLVDPSLAGVRFYDVTKGVPRQLYDRMARNSWKIAVAEQLPFMGSAIPKFVAPRVFVAR